MDLTEGGCSRGSTQCAPGLRLNAVQPARNRVGVAPCTVPPTSMNASNNLCKEGIVVYQKQLVRNYYLTEMHFLAQRYAQEKYRAQVVNKMSCKRYKGPMSNNNSTLFFQNPLIHTISCRPKSLSMHIWHKNLI